MFLQKLSLSPEKSYITSTTLENIIENLHLTFNHIPVITPYSSKGISKYELDQNLKKDKSFSILSIEKYSENKNSFDCTHLVVVDYDLFIKFGYDIENLPKPLIVIKNDNIDSKKFSLLTLCRFHLNFENEDSFVALFILSNLFRGKVVTKKVDRIKIFFKVFGIEWEIESDKEYESRLFSESSSTSSNSDVNQNIECLVFMDSCYSQKLEPLNSERIFIIGKNKSKNFETLKIDLSIAGKYKYRIGDVYRSITPAVLKGRSKFDYERFKNISK